MKCPNCRGRGTFAQRRSPIKNTAPSDTKNIPQWELTSQIVTCWLCKSAGKVGVKNLLRRIVRYKLKKASVSHKPPNGWWVIDRRFRPVRSWPVIIIGLIYTWLFCEGGC